MKSATLLTVLLVALLFAVPGLGRPDAASPSAAQDTPQSDTPSAPPATQKPGTPPPASEASKGERVGQAVSPAAKKPSPEPAAAEPKTLTVQDVFHIVGIPGLKRNARGDLTLTATELSFQKGNKRLLVLPFERIRRVEVVSGERHYGKSTAGAAMVTPFGLGALLILHKRKVDTLVIDYVNERGGLIGAVLQLPEHQGERSFMAMEYMRQRIGRKLGRDFHPGLADISPEDRQRFAQDLEREYKRHVARLRRWATIEFLP